MNRRLVAICGVVLAVAVAVPATAVGQTTPSPSAADEKVTFTVGVTGDLNSANPFRQIDTYEAFVGTLMYDSLLRRAQEDYSHRARAVPAEWETSEDGLTWTFHLREDATWSDGKPITAHDFVDDRQLHPRERHQLLDRRLHLHQEHRGDRRLHDRLEDHEADGRSRTARIQPDPPRARVGRQDTSKRSRVFRNFPDPVVSGPFTLASGSRASTGP